MFAKTIHRGIQHLLKAIFVFLLLFALIYNVMLISMLRFFYNAAIFTTLSPLPDTDN